MLLALSAALETKMDTVHLVRYDARSSWQEVTNCNIKSTVIYEISSKPPILVAADSFSLFLSLSSFTGVNIVVSASLEPVTVSSNASSKSTVDSTASFSVSSSIDEMTLLVFVVLIPPALFFLPRLKPIIYNSKKTVRRYKIRDVPDATLPDTGFNWIVIYRIPDIPDSSKFKHKS